MVIAEDIVIRAAIDESLDDYDSGDFEKAIQTFLKGLAGPEQPRKFHDKYYLHLRQIAAQHRRDWFEETIRHIAAVQLVRT